MVITRDDLIRNAQAKSGRSREQVEFLADLLILYKAQKEREEREDLTPVQRYYVTPDCMGLGGDS